MDDFDSHDRRGGRRFGGRDSGRRTMFSATCANCGKPCEVPFRPSGDRPIYCSDCFEKMGKREGPGGRGGRRNFDRPQFEGGRPHAQTGDHGKASAEIAEQLRNLGVKLDKVVTLLENQAVNTPAVKSRAVKKNAVEGKTAETPPASE